MSPSGGWPDDWAPERLAPTDHWLGSMRVRSFADASYIVWPKGAGHGRSVAAGTELAARLELALSQLTDGTDVLGELTRGQRLFAEGTHEPITAYRNILTGEWSIPPQPDIVPAEASDPQYERRDLRTLADADAAAREMRDHMVRKFGGDREFTEGMDQQFGDPTQVLRDRMATTHSNYERDTIRLLLTDLEREARDRERVSTEMYFHRREYDH